MIGAVRANKPDFAGFDLIVDLGAVRLAGRWRPIWSAGYVLFSSMASGRAASTILRLTPVVSRALDPENRA